MLPVKRDGKAEPEQDFLQDLAEYLHEQTVPIKDYEFSEEDVNWLKQIRICL